MSPSTRWMRDGLCAGSPTPDPWFPEPGQRDTVKQAKAICAACPVKAECLGYALALGIRDGIWGGTVPEERDGRKAHRRQRETDQGRRQQLNPATRQRKTEAERERRRRLREAAAAGDPEAAERLERERTRKRTREALATARQRARKTRAS
jgi:WhiB family transcriptional regulator, redox-sensing transcriptional regulator